jgi:hypothetical protein
MKTTRVSMRIVSATSYAAIDRDANTIMAINAARATTRRTVVLSISNLILISEFIFRSCFYSWSSVVASMVIVLPISSGFCISFANVRGDRLT